MLVSVLTSKKERKEEHEHALHAGYHWKPKSTINFLLSIFYWKSAYHQLAILFRNRTTTMEDPSADWQLCF